LHSDQGSSRALGEFFRLCDAARSDCAFSGGSRNRYSNLANRLRRDPIRIEGESGDEETFTYADLVATTLGVLYEPAIWPDAAEFFADLEESASEQRLGRRLAKLRAGLGLAAAAQEPYPNVREGFPGVACSDGVNTRSFEVCAAPPIAQPGSTATSGACGDGPAACAHRGRRPRARTATSVRGARGRRRRCWSSATTSTRRPATRAP
jgi:hypothetical protein